MFAAQSIQLGINDIVVSGGMESMSNAPKYLAEARSIFFSSETLICFLLLLLISFLISEDRMCFGVVFPTAIGLF